uniref:Coiled-coil domain-containing protein 178 n=2 Tax=Anser cygnoides TaxID=8845 RepID=A0A8B9DV76_ANSCY|nr:coiled-coil domain-containing protein 178 isoform X1 [Anser cygnoides]XP_013040414.2 coiled-coil domain-containing protein 178 isoform X1 [Anser cygnoides]XP_047905312.1 coiled-coil domain-containing protein 178 isoform X1 [Anser cygnoides]XP_047905313.1 coiled-coil domain-containing protein 178 isoform X1 [Anser cygnoides]
MFETQLISCSSKDSDEPPQDENEWTTIRQRSCAFVNTPLPCINKAIYHIQELEVKMEKCFQQYDHVFKEEKMPRITKQVSAESNEDIWLSLDFQEANVSGEDSKTLTLKRETEALLLEVTELIKRLEADREEAEKALERERQRRKKLGMEIDCMSLWRLQQLPAAVQKEYEMCAQDTLELRWHFDCKSRQLRQVEAQILKIETVNRKIQEDIDFMKKHSPLLEEKLKLEGEAVKDVLLAYEKASKIYSDVHSELMEIQQTMKRIDEEGKKKIKSLYEKIKYAGMLLSQFKNELKHSEFIWTEYCMKLKETEEKIIKDEKHLEELVKQKAEIQEDAKCWNSKVEDMNNKVAAQADESIKISDASSEMVKAMEELKSTRESDLQNIKQKLLKTDEALDALKCENEGLEGENEELLQEFRDSSRKKKTYQSEVQTICKHIQKTEEQIERLNEELCKTELSYSEKKAKYEEIQTEITAEKISYKNLEWNLKKEIQDGKEVWKVIQARIETIYGELEEKRKEKLRKREEDMKTIGEKEREVADLETKFKGSKNLFKENHEKLSYLDQRLQDLDKQQEQKEKQLEKKRTILLKQLKDIEEKKSFVSSKIAENSHAVENLKNELKELAALWNMKQIQMENTEKSFVDLRKNLSDVKFKQQNVQILFNHLQDELAEYEKRLQREEKAYGELLQTRKKDLKDSEATLEQVIKENLRLAQEYQISQNCYLNSKEDLTELYDNRIRMEASVRDYQQLCVLQSRMRRALAAYLSQRGLYGQAGLARIQAASQENAQKILAVQGELSKAIQHITAFLHSLTDGSSTIDNNANNQCILDGEIKDKKSHTVQITV